MNEAKWMTSNDSLAMLNFLRPNVSSRKARLFVIACARFRYKLPFDGRNVAILALAEQFADGSVNRKKLQKATQIAYLEGIIWTLWPDAGEAAERWASPSILRKSKSEYKAQARILRDLFGNPFQSVLPDPTWLTSTVQNLAEAIYKDRTFDVLPILADALEDAGCTNADILNHCRQPGEHVRGCWVIDLLTGRE